MEPIPLLALSALVIRAGAAVANLHALLERLDLRDIPPDERERQSYGEGTTRAVQVLQKRLNVQALRSGEVDERTARAINEHALERGILFVVAGLITRADGTPANGAIVRIADVDNLAGLPCAEVKTAERGGYLAFYDPQFYLPGRPGVIRRKELVDVVVRVVDAAGAEQALCDR